MSSPGGTLGTPWEPTPVGGAAVKQGPEWVVEIFVAPDWWVLPALVGAALAVGGVSYLGYQRAGLTDAVVEEMVLTGAIVMSIAATTRTLVALANWPYLADVAGGVIGGYVLAITTVQAVERVTGADDTGEAPGLSHDLEE
jgi:hypothetical protein